MRTFAFLLLLTTACAHPGRVNPPATPAIPQAAQEPVTLTAHGDTRVDPYYWLRERERPEVLTYLQSENDYASFKMKGTEELQTSLYEEMVARIKEDDETAPFRFGNNLYFSRTQQGKSYETHLRRDQLGNEETLLDENLEAKGSEYFALGAKEVSPNEKWLAYSVDFLGNERYELRFRDTSSGRDLPESVPDTYYSLAWSADSETVFYTRVDSANRPFQIWRHTLGKGTDALVYEEKDEAFHLSVSASRSGKFIFIQAQSAITTEILAIDATSPATPPVPVLAREQGVEYYVDHAGNFLYLLSNRKAQNFQLLRCPTALNSAQACDTVVEHDPNVTLSNLSGFEDFIVLEERRGGITTLRVRWHDGKEKFIPFPESSYTASLRDNALYSTDLVRFRYSSLVTPRSTFDFDVRNGTTTLVKQDEVQGYDAALYASERVFATATDGTKIPISLVYRKGALDQGPARLLLTGYGAYGINYDAYFSSSRISLLDRGFVYAIAHVRGGADMGRVWYEDGKLLNKKNTFTDFIATAEHLTHHGYTDSSKLAIEGSSAGGLLVGAVINMRPDLFRAAIAGVPFVDVLTTMSDPAIPLTVIEWEEWGNPEDKVFYNYIKSYSPYDNITRQNYPALLVTAGLNDPRVQYWEPAKWVAKLRTHQQGRAPILLKTNMGAGHGGASGRYDYLREIAFEYAFILEQLIASP
jgi:oligopeptidase B